MDKEERLLARFWSKVEKTEGCWYWRGLLDDAGYGLHGKGKDRYAHRWLWIRLRGEIGAGLDLDHTCNTRSCVRLDHLEPVTRKENLRRGVERRTHCRNGHEYAITGRPCKECRNRAQRDWAARQRAAGVREYWVWPKEQGRTAG